MNVSIRIAALLLGGAVFVGCDKSDTTTPPTPPTVSQQTVTPPAVTTPAVTTPDVSKTTSAINSAVDKGADAAKTEANKLMSSAPTTMPSMPK